jgi:hypothetical protein
MAMAASFVLGLAGSSFGDNEPQSHRESVLAALRAQCEADREANIKPLRDMEIAKCKATTQERDPEYCERYWRDWGSAVRRPDGTLIPRKFDDLPSCVAAFKAAQDLNWK